MNIRDLSYFLAVYELNHFGKAAERCHVSQPALSMQIKKLEHTLGLKLFERDNKRFFHTEAGHMIASHAKEIMQHVEAIKGISDTYQEPYSGTFNLGVFPTLSAYLLPSVVPVITQKFQNLKLMLREEKTERLLKKIRNGDLDAALVSLPLDDDSLEYQFLFADPFYLAVSVKHPLAKRKRISMRDIENESLLLLDSGHCLRTQAISICQYQNADTNHPFTATSMETLRQMVAANIGISLLPKTVMRDNDGVVYIPFTKPVPERHIALVWRKSSAKKHIHKSVSEIVIDVMRHS